MHYHPLDPWLGTAEPPMEALDGASRLIPGRMLPAAAVLDPPGLPPRGAAAAGWLLELDEFDGETVRVLIAGDEE